jgi:hypothetical protein
LSEAAIRAALAEENELRCQPPLPKDEVRQIAASAARYEPAEKQLISRPSMIGVDVTTVKTAQEAKTVLNALPVWQRRIEWNDFRRSGNTVIGTTASGRDVRLEQKYITNFARCQTAIWGATGLIIPTPPRKHIKPMWEQAAELIGRICMENYHDRGGVEDDLRVDLRRTFRAAGEPRPKDRNELAQILGHIQGYRRDPHAEHAPPAAFIWEHEAWVHPATVKIWLGTVPGGNTRTSISDVREYLSLLGFSPDRLEIDRGDHRIQISAWRGPAQVLEDE